MKFETPISKTATVSEMIIAELASVDRSLATSDLYERLELDTGDTTIHRAITALIRDGRIEHGEIIMGKRGQPTKTYRLPRSDATRLMEHLESELDASSKVDQADIRTRRIVDDDRGPTIRYPLSTVTGDLDTAAVSHNGDEMHVIHAHIPCEIATTFADLSTKHTDPILRALAQMDRRDPRIPDAAMHVKRIRALATHLDDGKAILPQMDLVAWLFDLAATLEESNEH